MCTRAWEWKYMEAAIKHTELSLVPGDNLEGWGTGGRLMSEDAGVHTWFTLYTRTNTALQSSYLGFPGGSDGKESSCSAGDPGSILGREDALGEEMAATPVFLPGESHGQRSLVGYSPQGRKESDMTEWKAVKLGFPGDASAKQPACQCRRLKETRVRSLG